MRLLRLLRDLKGLLRRLQGDREKIELDETQKTFLDEKLKVLLREKTPALFTYFQKDEQKEGGAYITVSGIVKKTDAYTHKIVLEDGTGICVEDILEIRKLL